MKEFMEHSTYGPYINGQFHSSHRGLAHELTSPVTGMPWKRVHYAQKSDVICALDGAEGAFQSWKSTPASQRAHILHKIADRLVESRSSLADIMVMEMGKPLKEARAEVDYAAGYFHWYAGEAVRIQGYEIAAPSPDKRLWVAKEAIGVCAAITPWNFPLAIPARKLAPAWAAGCPVLLKPSPECPLSALALADISQKAGLPEGVFQILCGDEKMLGELLLQDTRVRKLSFTGSTEVGKTLYRACAPSLKRVTLELGGHAPFIVFDDADLEQAVQGLLQAKFRNTGQTCVSPNRIYVHQDVYTVFVQRLVERCKRLREGDPRLEETDLSCFLHPSAQAKVKLHLEDALGKGAELLYAGEGSGAPRILSRVDESMLIAQEETFGPVIPLFSFESETEVLRAANASPFGLAAYVFTQGLGRARRCVEALEFGVIGLNDGAPSNPHAPFGGLKASGLGKEGGQSGMAEYLVEKFVSCLA